MVRPAKLWLRLSRKQAGFSLIETLVAASILAVIGVVFMSALFTGYRSVGILDERQQAEILARSQLEDIKSVDYQEDEIYPVTVDLPPNYSISIGVTSPTCIGTADDCVTLDELMGEHITTIQEITVYVYHHDKYVLAVACYKAIQ
jgi:prepilin-type N-terminal cleavage/methylation domain-containing protein